MHNFFLACCLVGMYCLTMAVREPVQRRHQEAFRSFVQQQGRTYEHGSPEYNMRLALFSKAFSEVEAHNRQPDRLWTAGINHLSDRTQAELSELRSLRGGVTQRSYVETHGTKSSFLESGRLSTDFNWTGLQAFSLSQVKDQRSCGSCWAFATSTMLQAHSEIHQKPNERTFSEQELVDCVPNRHHCGGSGGCAGATVELALKYVAKHGLATEEEWPYEAKDGKCRSNPTGQQSMLSTQQREIGDEENDDMSDPGIHVVDGISPGKAAGIKAWERLPQNDYSALMNAVVQHGPVAISAAASGWAGYKSGVFRSTSKTVDHAVVLLGYGELPAGETKYWLIQNSWTEGWGEQGKIRLYRSETIDCGLDLQPELGTGCDKGPKNVTVCGECGVLYDSVVPHFHKAGE
mmetsp:Transcript_56246/g.111797  ORF Transcript_56246/g.111797 Transcript_56246/m.111797 type:complete len:405 (-) Transcript_56246:84-1298(-)